MPGTNWPHTPSPLLRAKKQSELIHPAPPHSLCPLTPPALRQPPTLEDILQPSHPALKGDVPEAWSIQAINKWITAFGEAIQASAQDILRILQKSACNQLKEAATCQTQPRPVEDTAKSCRRWRSPCVLTQRHSTDIAPP